MTNALKPHVILYYYHLGRSKGDGQAQYIPGRKNKKHKHLKKPTKCQSYLNNFNYI